MGDIKIKYEFGLSMKAPVPIDNDIRWCKATVSVNICKGTDHDMISCYTEGPCADEVLKHKINNQLLNLSQNIIKTLTT